MRPEYISKKIRSIRFGLLSPKIIKKMAVAKIVTPELYDKEGYPVDGGLMDTRLGVIDPGLICKTDGLRLKESLGHFGYIELARPVIHIEYVKTITEFLKYTCRECSRILLPEKDILHYKEKKLSKKKVKKITDSMKNVKKCPHCGAKQYSIKVEKPYTFLENEKKLSPVEIRTRFEKILDEDISLLGLDPESFKPEWTILKLLLIPPVTIRPSITLDTGERSEDDLTHKLGDIVRINQRLFENINAGAPEVIVEDLWDLLQYHVTTYFNNTLTQIPPARHRSGQPLKTLIERIKSKEGRFRYNLTGKRVNFAARTVISPDPQIRFNEVGIPKLVAMDLTVPERVTKWNIDRLKDFVKNGSKKYPGSNYVIRPDGKKKKITDETREQLIEELQPGYVVERHLMNGDIAIFNRQPSLHKMSVMCHRIRIMPGRSFRLHPGTCVAPETLVQLSSGIQRPIEELKNCWKESELATYDENKQDVIKTELKKFWALKPEEYGVRCYKISTESGREIITTSDHPFYLKDSIKTASEIDKGDLAIIRPLDTPIYKQISKSIVTEKYLLTYSPKQTYVKHTLKLLKELKLIPLNLEDQRTMIIARLLGHLFGDGTFILNKTVARMVFRGNKKDLLDIQRDIESLGFKPEKIYIKTSNNKIETIRGKSLIIKGTGLSFEIRSKPLCVLFASLRAPNGNKTKIKYSIPKWVMKAPTYIQREFLASYFGSEMTKPRIRKKSKSNFDNFVFKISKIQENLDSGINLIKDIEIILKKFGVKINKINIEDGVKRKDGHLTKILATSISNENSKVNLLGKIGFIYNYKKDNIARLAYHYMLLKRKEISERNKKYNIVKKLRMRNYSFNKISQKLKVSINILEDWMYRCKKAGLPSNFLSFAEWSKQNGNINTGLIYDKIINIKETYVPFVYDITTTLDTHSFFANGFLTKNCFPYNADFDGDEMNLHIPQTEEARAEAEILMDVKAQLITPKNGLNTIGCIEDAITGNYILTKYMEISKEDAISLLLSIGVENTNKFKKFKSKVSGKEVFSALLPGDLSYIGKSKRSGEVIIRKGELTGGVIDDNIIGEEKGTLIRKIKKTYGEDIAFDILGKIFKLGLKVLQRYGFTTGISDTDLPEDVKQKIGNIIESAMKEVNSLIDKYKTNALDSQSSKIFKETIEPKILKILNQIRNKVGEVISQNAADKNPIIIMANSGARGNLLNLSMMSACVGQQALRGKRIERGYENRTISSVKPGEISPKSRGFIAKGFKSGLSPVEFFFSAMTGRDSLMDTALRTPKSGYLYRRLANALQDLKVEYDYTLRDANKRILQFMYGEDNIDVSKTEKGSINIQQIIQEIIKNA